MTKSSEDTVDFLGLQPSVDRSRIGIIGICGFGGMGLNAAAVDKRIRAVVTTSRCDLSRVMRKGYFDSQTKEQRSELLEQISQQRWVDAEAGRVRTRIPATSPKMPTALRRSPRSSWL